MTLRNSFDTRYRTKIWSPLENVYRWALFLVAAGSAFGFLFLAAGGGLGS